MSFILTKNAGVPVKYLIEGYVEQDTDRAQLRTDYTLGSKIKVIETGKSYVLTENGWKYLEESSFDPSVLDDYYTKEETDELIAALNSFVYVDTLPTENIKTNVIYLVPAEDPGDDDIKDEYLNLDGTSAGWERIGSTRIDLTQYYTKTETDAKFVEKEAGKGLSTNDYTTVEKQKLAGLNASDFATAAQGVKADNAETKNIEQDERLDTLEDEIIVTKTISGDFLHITDAAALPAESVVTTLEPVQNLHGYDKPWPAGGGKNLAKPITTFTDNGVTFNVDGQGVITLSGTAISNAFVVITNTIQLFAGQTITFSINNSSILGGLYGYGFGTYTITPTADFGSNGIQIQLEENVNYTGQVLKPQLELGSTATTFEPYSNICPISGHTGVELTRTGKNLLDSEIVWHANNISTFEGVSSDAVDTRIRTTPAFKFPFVGTFTISSLPNNVTALIQVNCFDANKQELGFATVNNFTFTTLPGTEYIYILLGGSGFSTQLLNSADIQLELGDTATTFEPYTPETHSITFPPSQSPVYGCEVDWVNGVLRVSDVNADLGTLDWDSRGNNIFSTKIRDYLFTQNVAAKCSQFNYVGTVDGYQVLSTNGTCAFYYLTGATARNFYVNDNRFDTVADFKAAMSGVQLVYELATPLEIPLTPQIITLLKGENNVWTDAGTSEIEYYPDGTIGEQIGELDNRITNLELSIQALQAMGLTIVNGQLCQTYTE